MISRPITSLSQLLADYLRKHDLKGTSAQQLDCTVRVFEPWYAATYQQPFDLLGLSEDLTCDFLHWCRDERGNAPKTLNRKRGDLLTLWRYAAKKGLLAAPNAEDIIRFREPERIPDGWTQEELAAQIAACNRFTTRRPPPGWGAREDRAIRYAIYDTGYRLSACMKLGRSNLRDDGAIMATAETQKTFADEVQWLGPDAMREIRSILAEHPEREHIFVWSRSMGAFWRRWKKINALAGLRHTRRDGPQKMRRTYASWIEHASPGSAEAALGHKTPGLAKKHYVDPRIARTQRPSSLLPRIVTPQLELF